MAIGVARDLEVRGPAAVPSADVLTPDVRTFVALLHHTFEDRRRELLARRRVAATAWRAGRPPSFLAETRAVREAAWTVAPPAADLRRRHVEITGPTDRKMLINALNSGADTFMADFEDANTPTWRNLVEGQRNLSEAIAGTIEHRAPDGRRYRLAEKTAALLVRPRGWHLLERHAQVDGSPVAGALFDAGVFLRRNALAMLERGRTPALYLPKLESHLEARLWSDVLTLAEDELGIPRGTVRVTVLVETLPLAFEMEEVLYELREHGAALNAGRWDYLFSVLKLLGGGQLLPDRSQLTMTVPFMRAYTDLLVHTCHRRGAYAIGGMAAFIPDRRDRAANDLALDRVRADKSREVGDGFDGTWVAHPDLVPVAIAEFARALGLRDAQLERRPSRPVPDLARLVDLAVAGGTVTEAGLRTNVSVGIRYLASWLSGIGAAAIDGLMEDAATAEISRMQVWQWTRHAARTAEGATVTGALVREVVASELARIERLATGAGFAAGRYREAAALFERIALDEEPVEFLTLPAVELID